MSKLKSCALSFLTFLISAQAFCGFEFKTLDDQRVQISGLEVMSVHSKDVGNDQIHEIKLQGEYAGKRIKFNLNGSEGAYRSREADTLCSGFSQEGLDIKADMLNEARLNGNVAVGFELTGYSKEEIKDRADLSSACKSSYGYQLECVRNITLTAK